MIHDEFAPSLRSQRCRQHATQLETGFNVAQYDTAAEGVVFLTEMSCPGFQHATETGSAIVGHGRHDDDGVGGGGGVSVVVVF